MVLEEILERKRMRLKDEMAKVSIEGWKQKIKRPGLHKPIDFYSSIKTNSKNNNSAAGVSIIAEVKKASPSRGIIREDFDPLEIAKKYQQAKVQAISVLTERDFFKGDDEYLIRIRQSCVLPILRKDFIIDIWQIYQSRCLGADAILLIVSVLSDEELKKFQIVAEILGMQCLVEVHDRKELERALESGAKIIGINNRNLKTFEVDIRNTEKLINYIPHDRAVVSESGIKTSEDIKYLKSLGVDAVLIGETFMRSSSIKDKVNELRSVYL